jgi:hypothetical protein
MKLTYLNLIKPDTTIDADELKIQRRVYPNFLPKSLGGLGFQEKLPGGGIPLFRVLLHFYEQVF